uniref:hsp90 co-chaperone Cdc37-like 1 isoform X4 n=1 Tax=Doryrhamphus excisus TaxID=161450 RepID=UPI0025AE678D|nr:hsp90 co-chaperone Cdc37-like 1 isoform X4 [Doryrhamphus excisus]
MEWRSNNDAQPDSDPLWTVAGCGGVSPIQQTPASSCDCAMASLCQSQQRCVKTSIVSSWMLAEAQERLCSLRVHCSESLEQERARTQSIINVQNQPAEVDQCKTFVQKYEQELRHFGMLRRWDDSQRFLAEKPQLICDETANYLFLWCIRLQQEGKEALMEQVAHQAVAMQFILEMASNSGQDPRGCFRQFFQKAKEGQEVYLEVFHSELEALKRRVREHEARCKSVACSNPQQTSNGTNCRLDPKEAHSSSPQQVSEFPSRRRIEAGRWTSAARWMKDDGPESEDIRMMETS